MGKRKFGTIATGCIIVIVLVIVMANSLHRSSHILLPAETSSKTSSKQSEQKKNDLLLDITPESVQAVIATLKRPSKYIRSLTVKTMWTGGSASFSTDVAVCGKYTRSDTNNGSGRIRHVITDGKTTYVWYNQSQYYYSGSSAGISADQEQHILTYEDILELKKKQIATADYQSFSDENCIYVETVKDANGYVQRYWVSVGSGLLLGAEKLQDGKTVYRMLARAVSDSSPQTKNFTLPDGKVLCKVDS